MKSSDKISIYLAEYDKLKQEQIHRLGVRDNLIYIMLTVFGAVFSYALSNVDNQHALLVVPWASLALGWVYLLNDKKVSSIKIYIRDILSENVTNVDADDSPAGFFWEKQSGERKSRKFKKIFQLFVDLVTFCFTGIASLSLYIIKTDLITNSSLAVILLGYISMILLMLWFIFSLE